MSGILRIVAVLALLLAAGLAGSAPVRAQGGKTVVVEAVDGNEFSPATVTINVGDTVVWRNADPDTPHNSVSNDDVWDSGNLDPGDEFSFTFEETGTFEYVCTYHDGMDGTIVVEEAAGGEHDSTDDTGAGDPAGDDADASGGDSADDDGAAEGDGGDHDMADMPATGAGAMAGGIPAGQAAAGISALLAGGYALRRR